MSGHGEKLSRKQELATTALLTEPTLEKAAKAAGVSGSTLRRWLQEPGFRNTYRTARGELLERTLSRLIQASGKAIATLERNLDCGNPATEVRAAATILRELIRTRELVDLSEQVQEQERRLSAVEHLTTAGGGSGVQIYIPANNRDGVAG